MIYKIETKQTIKDFLVDTPISKAMIKRIKRDGDFLVNGNHQTVRYELQPGDTLEIVLPKETTHIEGEDIPFDIVYEDDYYLIVDKPAGIPCIPTKRYPNHTLANGLIYYYQQKGIQGTVHLVNRLDKETSGYMVVAKESQAHALLSTNIKQVKRVYHCLVEGKLEGQGTINKPIYKQDDSMKRMIDEKGKPSITHYRVLKADEHQSLIQCTLETGRTHQIRVHLSSLHHPLIGDELYGSKQPGPFYLESVEVSFIHPYTHEKIHIKKEMWNL